jgi:hypothetical protein
MFIRNACCRTLQRFVDCNSTSASVSNYNIVNKFPLRCAARVFSHIKHKKRTCRVPANTQRTCICYLFTPIHMHSVASSKGGMHPLFETETADLAIWLAMAVLTFFLSRLCSIDQRAQCAPSCILCARLVGESSARHAIICFGD